jgi:hypothetical protein
MRKYVRFFAKIAAPITDLLKRKSERIIWTRDCHESFEALMKTLTEAPVLTIVDPLKGGLVLCTDASDMAIGDVLMQEGRVIAYESKELKNVELNYPVHEKQLLAIIHALKVWRHYLLGSEFKIETNHQSLRYLIRQANLYRKQSHWMELMQEFNFEIQ